MGAAYKIVERIVDDKGMPKKRFYVKQRIAGGLEWGYSYASDSEAECARWVAEAYHISPPPSNNSLLYAAVFIFVLVVLGIGYFMYLAES